jgi:gamma-glutamylputrescine oxidase
VLDRRGVAGGATGRSAGLLTLGTGALYARAIRSLGRERARDIWRFTDENRRAIQALSLESKDAFGYEACGSVWLAQSEEEKVEALRSLDLLNEDGFETIWWERDRLRSATGSSAFLGGLYREADAAVDPARLNAAIESAAARSGAVFVHDVDVREASESEDGVVLETDRGRLRAEMLLLCGDALVARLDPFFHDTIVSAPAQMVQTAPVSSGLEIPIVTHFGHEFARRGPDGSILAGGMRWALPDFGVGRRSEKPVPELTARLLGLSCDGLAFVGPVPGRPRLLVAAGYSGRGLAMGFLAGRILGQMVVGDPVPEEWTRHFSPRRMV